MSILVNIIFRMYASLSDKGLAASKIFKMQKMQPVSGLHPYPASAYSPMALRMNAAILSKGITSIL